MANPIVAAILSFFIPGLGQLYGGRLMRGVVIFLCMLLSGSIIGVLSMFTPYGFVASLLILLPFIFWLWNIYDAYTLAK